MSLAAGTRLGPYEIVAPIGSGGMGEVYRARDTRLGRDVAIKVLPQHLSANPEVRARFEREAKTVSSLSHPNICTLFDVGREGDTDYLVMELVEGDTLAHRLHRGPLPPAELLRLGTQIAEALERAHRAGVIHRDLKPGNVMITKTGAKLMDFGLSRATGLSGGAGSSAAMTALSQSPTMAQALTAEGTILGTFQYMSPEQLEGREADARSDIWALGCVLYEMATGRRAFEGRSQASLIAAILERDPPPLGTPPPSTGGLAAGGPPVGIEGLIRDCLIKDPDERIQTAHEVKLRLQRIAETAGLPASGIGIGATPPTSTMAAPVVVARARQRRETLAWAIAAAAAVAAVVFGVLALNRPHASPNVFRFKVETEVSDALDPNWPRISPDGRMLVFEASDSNQFSRAWLLHLDDTTPHPIPGTERLSRAYWSPDSREIVFVADGKIQRAPVTGGSPVIVCPAPGGSDLSWGAKGMILMDGRASDSLRVVSAQGGELHPATRIYRSDHEMGSAWPCFLPDGEHFLFIGTRAEGGRGDIRLGRLGSLDSKLLGQSDGRVEYAPGDWALFVRSGSLVAQKLSVGAGRLEGDPITIVDDLRIGESQGHFSISRGGVLALQRGPAEMGMGLEIVDRSGKPQSGILTKGMLGNLNFSPDGRKILYERKNSPGTPWGDVSVYDLDRGTDTPLTFTGGLAVGSDWSPDGRRFVYTLVNGFQSRIMIGSSDGLGAADSIPGPTGGAFVTQWAAHDSRIVGFNTDFVAIAAPSEGVKRVFGPLLDKSQVFALPQISPDGRWVSGTSGTASSHNVFVQSLAGPPGRWQISSGGNAARARWTKGGRELVYENDDRRLMAVDIDTKTGFHAGVPHELFTLPLSSPSPYVGGWTCDANAQRFIVLTATTKARVERTIEVWTDFQSLVTRK
jgi:Tol biopolymer transport system component